MKETVRVAVVGLGMRGYSLLDQVLVPMCADGGLQIAGICDLYDDRIEAARKRMEKDGLPAPVTTKVYAELLSLDIDAVLIFTDWVTHIPFACEAMRAGIYAGIEVGGAYNLEDCWTLVHTSEETGVPCMLLENCCYGSRELMITNMVRQGVFGEVSHCAGGYRHDLRSELADSPEQHDHYRVRDYLTRNGDNYPTHELGPIAKLLDINRGNRLVSLNSIASSAKGMAPYIREHKDADHPLADATFQQGDVITTVIRCARGETITMTLDTTLPRYYSRQFSVHGTRAMYTEDNDSLYIDGKDNKEEFHWQKHWGNAADYEAEYIHPLWKNYNRKDPHGGIDWHVLGAFLESVRLQGPVPIDVYDAATWMAVSALSEASVQAGGAPVAIPDFTSGRWLKRAPVPDTPYRLARLG